MQFADNTFQYALRPYWNVIDYLPKKVFAGIPGYDLSTHKQIYYRVNMIPGFVKMRTPNSLRDDLHSFLIECEMNTYERFEWALKSERRVFFDNLFIEEKAVGRSYHGKITNDILNEISIDDTVYLEHICDFDSSNAKLAYNIYRLLVSGCRILISDENGREISSKERHTMLYLLQNMLDKFDSFSNEQQASGIAKAKEEGKFAGRKKKEVDPMLLKEITHKFRMGEISEEEAMLRLNVGSRSTLYRRMKEVK